MLRHAAMSHGHTEKAIRGRKGENLVGYDFNPVRIQKLLQLQSLGTEVSFLRVFKTATPTTHSLIQKIGCSESSGCALLNCYKKMDVVTSEYSKVHPEIIIT